MILPRTLAVPPNYGGVEAKSRRGWLDPARSKFLTGLFARQRSLVTIKRHGLGHIGIPGRKISRWMGNSSLHMLVPGYMGAHL
jgi:hypothetical protein